MSFAKPTRSLALSTVPNSTIIRLSIVIAAVFAWLLLCGSLCAQSSEQVSEQVAGPLREGRTVRVKVILEAVGELHPIASQADGDAAAQTLPMKAIANLAYDEVAVPTNNSISRSARYYHQAHAQLSVSSRPQEGRLRESVRYIFCDHNEEGTHLYSSAGALNRSELELITVPCNSAILDKLIPTELPQNGDSWQHPDELIAQLLNLDAVTANDVSSSAIEIDDVIARMTIKGKVIGSVDGVITELDINGKYNLDRHAGYVSWIALTISEDRNVGPSVPGFKVDARIRVAVEEIADESFARQAIKSAVTGPSAGLQLIEFEPQDSSFTVLHGREWHVLSNSPKHAVLRMVNDGQTVAQCNMRELPIEGKSKALSLEKFQQEVVKGLSSANPQIVDATEAVNPAGLRVLRVQVSGIVSNATVQWIYHLATSDDGRGISYIFTMAGDQAEEFGVADLEFTSTLRFSDAGEKEPRMVELPRSKAMPR